uniref:Uncharacterized protein n=1 Tax=Rhizophora mucronata TaxID=61149 RepID=A0A2P2LMR0_RHIMU
MATLKSLRVFFLALLVIASPLVQGCSQSKFLDLDPHMPTFLCYVVNWNLL